MSLFQEYVSYCGGGFLVKVGLLSFPALLSMLSAPHAFSMDGTAQRSPLDLGLPSLQNCKESLFSINFPVSGTLLWQHELG